MDEKLREMQKKYLKRALEQCTACYDRSVYDQCSYNCAKEYLHFMTIKQFYVRPRKQSLTINDMKKIEKIVDSIYIIKSLVPLRCQELAVQNALRFFEYIFSHQGLQHIYPIQQQAIPNPTNQPQMHLESLKDQRDSCLHSQHEKQNKEQDTPKHPKSQQLHHQQLQGRH